MMQSMSHTFSVDIATKYGMEEAVIIHNFQFWLNKNYSDGINRYDDRTWTYNTPKSLAKLFPYMTARAVRYAIDNLVKHGVLIKGNYNKVGYDRTLWYAFFDESKWLYTVSSDLPKTSNGNDKNGNSDLPKTSNGNDKNGTPIPDNKQQIVNTDSKQYKASADAHSLKKFNEFYAEYPKKEGRINAEKSWSKISPDLYEMIISDVINRKANHAGWIDKNFICAPSVYLNQKRWTDEIREASFVQQKTYQYKQPVQRPVYEYTPSNSVFDSMKTIEGEVI